MSRDGLQASPQLFDPRVLHALLATDEPTAPAELQRRLALPPHALRAGLSRLAELGCDIQMHPQHGVSLRHAGLATWVDYLRWRCPRLDGSATPRIIEVYRRTASTQDTARRIGEHQPAAASDGALAIADEQTAGRGRLGRRWVAPPGAAVTFSMLHLPPAGGPAPSVDRLMLAAAVAVAQALERLTAPRRPDLGIKWPNDILVAGRKLAGILIETFASPAPAAVIGVGVNVALRDDQLDDLALRARVTSLSMLGLDLDRLTVLAEVVRHLDAALRADSGALADEWRRRSLLLAQPVRLLNNGQELRGQVVDLDPQEGLIVRTDAGTVVHLPAATTTLL